MPVPTAIALESSVQVVDKPKRPLSAYNLFFSFERNRLVAEKNASSQGAPNSNKLGFPNLAKTVAAKWNKIDPELKAHFDEKAREEKIRYKKALSEWKKYNKAQQKRIKSVGKSALGVQVVNAENTPSPVPWASNESIAAGFAFGVQTFIPQDRPVEEFPFRVPVVSASADSEDTFPLLPVVSNESMLAGFSFGLQTFPQDINMMNANFTVPPSKPFSSTSARLMELFQSKAQTKREEEPIPFTTFGADHGEVPSGYQASIVLEPQAVNLLHHRMDLLAERLEPDCMDFLSNLFD
mmetsp:Transcript_19876/g.25602  ORF Transcript_19876/g.25602 Transcript_19876/m.25602 type:complete len:295 (-) Transcript_19876:12-896(-)